MKRVDLGFGAVAFEPSTGKGDRIESLDVGSLRSSGLSENAIKTYIRFRDSSVARNDHGSHPAKSDGGKSDS